MSLVLIVEDDVLLRARIARVLHKLPNVDVLEAGTVEEAVELTLGMELDLVLTDLQLADGTALDLLPYLARSGRRIPTLVLSGCVSRFADHLPPDLRVLEKPVEIAVLRDTVASMLGCPDHASPFGVADYLQLAGFGRHSVQLEVSQAGEHVGTIVIRDGEGWSACDALGDGLDALVRLIALPDATLVPSPPTRTPRSLHGPCEYLLLEAARLVDERRSMRASRPTPVPAAVPLPPPLLAEGTARRALPQPDPGEFERLYDEGIDMLIRKRYVEAHALLVRARAIRSTPTLDANLRRLESMGFS